MYICTITSNSTNERQYDVVTKSAMKCANAFGRCEGGEEITVSTKSGKPLSKVIWTQENGGKYIRVNV